MRTVWTNIIRPSERAQRADDDLGLKVTEPFSFMAYVITVWDV